MRSLRARVRDDNFGRALRGAATLLCFRAGGRRRAKLTLVILADDDDGDSAPLFEVVDQTSSAGEVAP